MFPSDGGTSAPTDILVGRELSMHPGQCMSWSWRLLVGFLKSGAVHVLPGQCGRSWGSLAISPNGESCLCLSGIVMGALWPTGRISNGEIYL